MPVDKPNISRFYNDLQEELKQYISLYENINIILRDKSYTQNIREVINSQLEDIDIQFRYLDDAYKKYLTKLSGHKFESEIDSFVIELFDGDTKGEKFNFIKLKLIYENLSSYYKLVETSWANIFGICKIFTTYPELKDMYEKLKLNLDNVQTLLNDTKSLLQRIETIHEVRIVGTSKIDRGSLVSNFIFDESVNYDFKSLFLPEDISHLNKPKPPGPDDKKNQNEKIEKKATGQDKSQLKKEYYCTELIGTKEWNRNDSYILVVRNTDLKEEEKKFYSSSFITLNPSETGNINLAAALVRKNSGVHITPKYNKMVQTLLEFTVTNLFTKDFPDLCEDVHSFLYHIGPIVIYNIIQDDMVRRDFGYCYYVDNNKIIKFFPENIIRKHVIDFWIEKFFDLKPASVDSYINYSKAVSNIRESYKKIFDYAASTKRSLNDSLTTEEYMRENIGKYFGYRRAFVYKKFVYECVFGSMPENNSVELVNKFFSGKK